MQKLTLTDQALDHLRNLKMHRSMESDEMNPWVQRELAGEVVKPLSLMSGRPARYPLIGKEEKNPYF